MGEQTRKLLEECSKGCKMAAESIDQIREHIKDRKMQELVSGYRKKHRDLEREADRLLAEEGEEEPQAGLAVSAMSWITTNVKLLIDESGSQIAKLLMDGCNMGIQGITEAQNRYKEASRESRSLAEKLVKLEEQFSKDLKVYYREKALISDMRSVLFSYAEILLKVIDFFFKRCIIRVNWHFVQKGGFLWTQLSAD